MKCYSLVFKILFAFTLQTIGNVRYNNDLSSLILYRLQNFMYYDFYSVTTYLIYLPAYQNLVEFKEATKTLARSKIPKSRARFITFITLSFLSKS